MLFEYFSRSLVFARSDTELKRGNSGQAQVLGPFRLLFEVLCRQMPVQCWPAPQAQVEQDCHDQVPCLKITDTTGQVQWIKDSGAIISYLKSTTNCTGPSAVASGAG